MAQCPDEQNCNVPTHTHTHTSYLPFIHKILKFRAENHRELWWRLKKREIAIKKCCAEVYTKDVSSYSGYTYLINYVIEQLKYSHWGSAVRSICCVQKDLIYLLLHI